MKKTILFLLFCAFIFSLSNCKKGKEDDDTYVPPAGTSVIPSSAQRSGDASTGYTYLTSGDYISSGIPYQAFITAYGQDNANVLGRTGDNAVIAPGFTAVNAPNGVRVVAPNCMQCHASSINGNYIVGLGNAGGDFTSDQSTIIPLADGVIQLLYGGTSSPEYQAYKPFRDATMAIGSKVVTEVQGANVADKLAAVLAAHRDPETLEWLATPAMTIPDEVIPTDVPAWWLLKKKNAMFFNGMGRGDYSRYLMASSLLTMVDSSKANEVNEKFPDILAYINSIQPPAYPQTINTTLAEEGKTIFTNTCAKCHGTYGSAGTYPNLLVSQATVGTDPKLAGAYDLSIYTVFKDWFNNGWFGTDPNGAELVPGNGYVAQPLDGIWATAPYLHNGSVPTLEDLLNSSQRPTYWKRTFQDSDYDHVKVGWNYTNPGSKVDKQTYDATIDGYGNQGHLFGDPLTTQQRTALIEYLKTL